MTATIEVSELKKTYRSGLLRRRNIDALCGISLAVERGEIFGLLGPNGAGKTTFIKVLLGIVRKTGGQASLLGHPAGSRVSRMKVGYMPEHLRFPSYHTAETALEFYGRLSRMSYADIRRRRAELLDRVGLAGRTRESVARFSKGMLQRLGLAQALMHDPDVLVLDEPTDGLDPVGRAEVRRVLTELRGTGKTVFVNSHLLQEVEMICDRVAILQTGSVRFIGPVEQLTNQEKTHCEVELVVVGSWDLVQQQIPEKHINKKEELGENRIRFVTRAAGQTQVDELVDQLRSRGISIESLVPKRVSLEDAFLDLVADAEVVE